MHKHLGTIAYVAILVLIAALFMAWVATAPIPSPALHSAPIARVTSHTAQPVCRGAAAETCEYLVVNSAPMIPASCPYGWHVSMGDICYNPKHPATRAMMICPVQTVLITQDSWQDGERAYCLLPAGMQSVCLLPAVETGYQETGDLVHCVNLPRVASRADLASGYYAPPCGTMPGYVACYAPCFNLTARPVPCQPLCSPSGECATVKP